MEGLGPFNVLEEMGELLTEPRALREGYLEQLRQFTDELKKTCRGMGIDYQRFSSRDSLDVALSQFLAKECGPTSAPV